MLREAPLVARDTAALVALLRALPVLPAPLVEHAVTAARADPDGQAVLAELLTHPEVPLARLAPAYRATAPAHPAVAAAYLNRDEHDAATVAALLAADPRPQVLLAVARAHRVAPLVAAALVAAGDDLEVLCAAANNPALPVPSQALAVQRALAIAPPAPPARRTTRDADRLRGALVGAVESGQLPAPVYEHLALTVDDPDLLVRCAPHVSGAAAADRVATVALLPAAADRTDRNVHRALSASVKVAPRCSPAVREELIAAWRECSVSGAGARDRAWALARMGATDRTGWLWSDLQSCLLLTRRGQPASALTREVVDALTGALGDDPAAWAALPRLAEGFTGTLEDLVTAARAVAADPTRS